MCFSCPRVLGSATTRPFLRWREMEPRTQQTPMVRIAGVGGCLDSRWHRSQHPHWWVLVTLEKVLGSNQPYFPCSVSLTCSQFWVRPQVKVNSRWHKQTHKQNQTTVNTEMCVWVWVCMRACVYSWSSQTPVVALVLNLCCSREDQEPKDLTDQWWQRWDLNPGVTSIPHWAWPRRHGLVGSELGIISPTYYSKKDFFLTFIIWKITFIYCVIYVYMHMHVVTNVHTWRSEDNLRE